jgi:LemA protein
VTGLYLVLGVLAVFALAVIASYNRFVRQRNLVQESWRQVDVELTRRHDLVPNLVSTVKGYAAHERAVFAEVVAARAAALAHPASVAAVGAVETQLAGALRGLLAVSEAYPELKAAGPFLSLQAQLAETEDRIAAARRFYNGNVRALNTRVEAFPSSVIAGLFGFTKAEYFETADPVVRAPVNVDLNP